MPEMQTTAASTTKLHETLAELQTRQTMLDARANWKRAQRAAWGSDCRETDCIDETSGGGEVIAVDSEIHTHNYYGPTGSKLSATQPASAAKPGLGTLAKLGIGAALVASGAGIPAGIGLLTSGAKDAAVQQPVMPELPANWMLELGKQKPEGE